MMSLPALRALKDNCPGDSITLVVKQYLCEIYKGIDAIKEIMTIPDNIDFGNLFRSAAKLKKCRCAAGILLTNSFNSALLFRLAGIKELTGYNKDLRGFLLRKKLKYPGKEDRKHHVFFYQDLVAAFSGKKIEKQYSDELIIGAGEKQGIGRLIASKFGIDMSKILIGISPSAAYGSAKQWLPERFVDLMRRIIRQKKKVEILLFGSGKEREKIAGIIEEVNNKGVHNLAGELTLRETIAAISLCGLFIANDSGLMHAASSLRVPLIAIFGPNSPQKTGPLFKGAKVLYHPVECSPCKHRDCPIDHRCMKAVTVEEVYQEVFTIFNAQQSDIS